MDKYTNLISLYMEDALSEAETTELEQHLKSCSVCQQAHLALKRIDLLFMNTPMVAPAPDFVARFEVRLERRLNRRRNMIGAAIIGAVLLLAAGLLVWSFADSGLYLLNLVSSGDLFSSAMEAAQGIFSGSVYLIKISELIGETLLRLIQHPVFIGYALLVTGLVSLWAQLVRWFAGPSASQTAS
jgi:hypothetical protein